MVKDYSEGKQLTSHGCKRQLVESDTWYFWLSKTGLQDKGWTASLAEQVYCGQVSHRGDSALRICEDCCKRKGYIW